MKREEVKGVPVYWRYIGDVMLPPTLIPAVKEEWADTLKAEVKRIYHALTAKIPNEPAFKAKIATPSSTRFDEFLASVGEAWDMCGIKLKQRLKLSRAYGSWKGSVDKVFGTEAPLFPSIVDIKKDKVEELRRVIGAVGHKAIATWEPVSMAVLLARGDRRPMTYFDANDSFTGTLESVFDVRRGALITPSLIAEQVYACVLAKYADEAGLATDREAIITASNTRIDDIIQVGLNDKHKAPGYDFTLVLSWNPVTANIRVVATDIHP